MDCKKISIRIDDETAVAGAAAAALQMAGTAGFGRTGQYMIATVVSELATNIERYGGIGNIVVEIINGEKQNGIEVTARDSGAGIENIEAAMQDGFSTTKKSLGVGLPGVKRLMDTFSIDTGPGAGTLIVARKWV